MHFKIKQIFFLFVLSFFLAACNTATTVNSSTTGVSLESPDLVASIEIDESATIEALEAEYDAKVITFKPKAGFAIIGYTSDPSNIGTLNLSGTSNTDAFETPEFSAQALDGAGHSAWAGGHSAWAGGHSAWAGGWSAWAGGSTIPSPAEVNNNTWEQINLYEAHRVSKNFGAGVKVAVIDTGIDFNHPLFQGSLAPSSEWRDYIDNDNYPSESSGSAYGHGTGVAGIILQIAPKATILPIRVLDGNGKGDTDDVIRAITHAVDSGAQIINASLGTLSDVSGLYTVLSYAADNGAYVASSTGNYGPTVNMTKPGTYSAYHGTYKHVFGVGSLDSNGNLSSFTSYREYLSSYNGYRESAYAYAPGERIYSAYPGNRMAHYTGTSFASPLLAGAAALAYSEIPNKSNFETEAYDLFDQTNLNVTGVEHYSFSYKLDVADFVQNQPGWTQTVTNDFGTVTGTSQPVAATKTLSKSGYWSKSGGRSSTSSSNPKYTFDVTSTGDVTIDLTSSVDTYLYLLNSSGSVIATNDDGGQGYNSRKTIRLSPGSYKVVAATYSSRKSGSFNVTVKGYVNNLR